MKIQKIGDGSKRMRESERADSPPPAKRKKLSPPEFEWVHRSDAVYQTDDEHVPDEDCPEDCEECRLLANPDELPMPENLWKTWIKGRNVETGKREVVALQFERYLMEGSWHVIADAHSRDVFGFVYDVLDTEGELLEEHEGTFNRRDTCYGTVWLVEHAEGGAQAIKALQRHAEDINVDADHEDCVRLIVAVGADFRKCLPKSKLNTMAIDEAVKQGVYKEFRWSVYREDRAKQKAAKELGFRQIGKTRYMAWSPDPNHESRCIAPEDDFDFIASQKYRYDSSLELRLWPSNKYYIPPEPTDYDGRLWEIGYRVVTGAKTSEDLEKGLLPYHPKFFNDDPKLTRQGLGRALSKWCYDTLDLLARGATVGGSKLFFNGDLYRSPVTFFGASTDAPRALRLAFLLFMLEYARPACFEEQDRFLNNPLHIALKFDCTPEVLACFFRRLPLRAYFVKNRQGFTPSEDLLNDIEGPAIRKSLEFDRDQLGDPTYEQNRPTLKQKILNLAAVEKQKRKLLLKFLTDLCFSNCDSSLAGLVLDFVGGVAPSGDLGDLVEDGVPELSGGEGPREFFTPADFDLLGDGN